MSGTLRPRTVTYYVVENTQSFMNGWRMLFRVGFERLRTIAQEINKVEAQQIDVPEISDELMDRVKNLPIEFEPQGDNKLETCSDLAVAIRQALDSISDSAKNNENKGLADRLDELHENCEHLIAMHDD